MYLIPHHAIFFFAFFTDVAVVAAVKKGAFMEPAKSAYWRLCAIQKLHPFPTALII